MNDLAYDKLKCFFYLLLRDEIPFGKVNEIIEKMPQKDGHYPCHFTSEELESYCEKIIGKICGDTNNERTLRNCIKKYNQNKDLEDTKKTSKSSIDKNWITWERMCEDPSKARI